MKSLLSITTVAVMILLTGCGGDSTDVTATTAPPPVQLVAATAFPVTKAAMQVTAHEMNISSPKGSLLDGKWACAADDGLGSALELEVAGNVLREVVSDKRMLLSYDKGIALGAKLVDYRDAVSGQIAHAPMMTQVDKPGFASMFSAGVNGGAGAGVEFSLNPNDTLKISDYSAMTGANSVGQVIPLTCRREPA